MVNSSLCSSSPFGFPYWPPGLRRELSGTERTSEQPGPSASGPVRLPSHGNKWGLNPTLFLLPKPQSGFLTQKNGLFYQVQLPTGGIFSDIKTKAPYRQAAVEGIEGSLVGLCCLSMTSSWCCQPLGAQGYPQPAGCSY